MVKICVPDRRWKSKTIWRRSCSGNIHIDTGQPFRWVSTTRLIDGWWESKKWFLVQGTAFTVITLNRESNFSCREKCHSQFHYDILTWPELWVRPWMWCLNAASTNFTIEGDRDLSDAWMGTTRFTLLDEKLPDGLSWCGRRLKKKQTTYRPDHPWPEMWKNMSDAAQRKERCRSQFVRIVDRIHVIFVVNEKLPQGYVVWEATYEDSSNYQAI